MQPSQSKTLGGSFEVCPNCDYDGGFHVVLERRDDVAGTDIRIHLKCPSCGTAYDVGWVGRLGD
jgi:uncharacterized Zn finger protein